MRFKKAPKRRITIMKNHHHLETEDLNNKAKRKVGNRCPSVYSNGTCILHITTKSTLIISIIDINNLISLSFVTFPADCYSTNL